jgi:hypothetical protein
MATTATDKALARGFGLGSSGGTVGSCVTGFAAVEAAFAINRCASFFLAPRSVVLLAFAMPFSFLLAHRE